METHTQPRFRRELQSSAKIHTSVIEAQHWTHSLKERLPAHKVADNIGVAHQDFVTIFFLRSFGSVEVFSESSFYPRAISIKLLMLKWQNPLF